MVLYHKLRRVCIRFLPLSLSPLPPPSRLKFFPCRFALRWLYYLDALIRLGDIRGKQWLIQGPSRFFFVFPTALLRPLITIILVIIASLVVW